MWWIDSKQWIWARWSACEGLSVVFLLLLLMFCFIWSIFAALPKFDSKDLMSTKASLLVVISKNTLLSKESKKIKEAKYTPLSLVSHCFFFPFEISSGKRLHLIFQDCLHICFTLMSEAIWETLRHESKFSRDGPSFCMACNGWALRSRTLRDFIPGFLLTVYMPFLTLLHRLIISWVFVSLLGRFPAESIWRCAFM